MKYREIIADNLKKAGWSLGWVSCVHRDGRTIWIANAHHRLLIDDSAVALEEPFGGAFEDDAMPSDKRESSSSVHVQQQRLRRQPLGEILSATIETR